MKYALSILLFTISLTAYAQLETESDQTASVIIQKQQMEKGYYYQLEKTKPDALFINPVYQLSLFGIDNQLVSKTILNKQVYSMGNPIEALFMQFISVNTGFIYGYEHGYGEFPMLYKTTDRGKTWKRVLFEERESLCPLFEDSFQMFNQKQGIMIVNPIFFNSRSNYNKQHFDYLITTDGGVTWEKKMIDLKAQNISISNYNHAIKSIFQKDGTIITIIKDTQQIIVLRSDDFGATFRVLE